MENQRPSDLLVAPSFHGMLGDSKSVQDLFTSIRKVAQTDVSVFLIGENGTGKELAARAIHEESLRKNHPFVAINCAAIPESLLESELFGHEKGSFTGAHEKREGKINAAAGGTLFLDEVGEVSLTVQVKLLRFLQEHVIERVGSGMSVKMDIRVVAATNRNLIHAISLGQFREDLYYRLCVVTLTLPPLRERGKDIVLLAHAFLNRLSKEMGKKIKGFSPDGLDAIMAYSWPGNIREMDNRIKRAIIMADGTELTPNDLGFSNNLTLGFSDNLRGARDIIDREMVQKILYRNRGNIAKSARELHISRPTLYSLIEKHQIKM